LLYCICRLRKPFEIRSIGIGASRKGRHRPFKARSGRLVDIVSRRALGFRNSFHVITRIRLNPSESFRAAYTLCKDTRLRPSPFSRHRRLVRLLLLPANGRRSRATGGSFFDFEGLNGCACSGHFSFECVDELVECRGGWT
jgi:hypothetical protein